MKNFTLFFIAFSAITFTVKAQPNARPISESNPKIIAEMYTDRLEQELSLSQKQRKKIYKIVLKQTKKKQADMAVHRPAIGASSMGRGGSPESMGPGGSGGPSGSMGGGGMGGGSMGGGSMGGGRGPRGSGGHGSGQRPPKNSDISTQRLPSSAIFSPEETEKDIEEREKQMKKILDPAQFSRWQELEQERRENEKERKRIEEQMRLFPQYEKNTTE